MYCQEEKSCVVPLRVRSALYRYQKDRADMEEKLSVFMFFEVKARGSGDVVELLHEAYEEVMEAAAVYSDTDVVARAWATRDRLGEILLELMQGDISVKDHTHSISDTFTVDSIYPFLVDGTLSWVMKEDEVDKDNIYAYVVIETDPRYSLPKILAMLRKRQGIIYTASLANKNRIIAKVRADSKSEFDKKVMDQIQDIRGVSATRSHLIINAMHKIRAEPTPPSKNPLQEASEWAGEKGKK